MNKLIKKILSGVIATTIAFTTSITGFATELPNSTTEKNIVTIRQFGSTLNYIKYTDGSSLIFPKNISSDNLPAYCLEQAKPNPPTGGITYNRGGNLDAGITFILENGLHEYGQVNRNPNYLVGNDDYDFYITQTAIHIYNGMNDKFMSSSIGDARILSNARQLVSDARTKATEVKSEDKKALTVSISPSTQTLEYKANTGYFETELYSITTSGEYTNYRVLAKGLPVEMDIVNQDGVVVTNSDIAPNSKFKLRIKSEDANKGINIQLGARVQYQKKVSDELLPSNNKYQKVTTLSTTPTQQEHIDLASASLTIGNIDVEKTSDTGKVDGFSFALSGNGIDKTVVTDTSGKASFGALPVGSYTVSEINLTDEFIQPNPQIITVTTGDTVTSKFHNTIKKGNISGYKKGDNGMNLCGAEIGLFRDDDTEFTNPVLTRITNEIGYFEFQDIPYGDYIVKEIKSPDGYILSDKTYPVTVRENGVTIEIEDIINTIMKGSVKGIKTDAISGKPLAGAEIGLYAYTDKDMTKFELVESMITGEDGLFSFTDIPYGNYYIMEIASPEGFILSDKKYPVDIFSDGLVVNISMVNQPEKGKIDIEYIKPDGKPNISIGTIKNPSTGDVSGILLFIITGLGGLVTLLFMKKRKVNNNG